MRKDIMVDIETLGTKEGASIFQIAAMSFNIETGESYDSINLIGDVGKYDELSVDGRTLKWWLTTNKQLLSDLLNKGNLSELELSKIFHNWINKQSEDSKEVYLWGSGILFDNSKLQKLFTDTDLDYPIYYKNDRDVRTILELASMKSGLSEQEIKDFVSSEDEVKHDALDDTRFQIRLVCKCYEIIMNKQVLTDFNLDEALIRSGRTAIKIIKGNPLINSHEKDKVLTGHELNNFKDSLNKIKQSIDNGGI